MVPNERESVTHMLRNPTRRNHHKIGLLVTFLLLVSVLVTVAEPPASATVPGSNGKIAYTRSGAIWTMNADGSNQTRLTPQFVLATYHEPAWSPDGTKIAYRISPTQPPGATDNIGVINADGTGATNLTSTAGIDEFEPTWSPDGSTIAYRRDNAIWTMDADGSNQATLTTPPLLTSHHEPAWSPDGTKIAYWFYSNSSSEYGIEVVNADGTGTIRLTDTSAGYENQPAWSPDGTKIVYTRGSGIWRMSADGRFPIALTAPVMSNDAEPAWSPDGAMIAYRHRFGFGGGDDIFAMNAGGTGSVNLTNTTGVDESDPDWQTLNRSPVPVDDTYSTPKNATLSVPAPGVLGNDTDPDGDALAVHNPSGVSAFNGTMTMAADGSFTYVPDPGYSGTDYISYRATDGTTVSQSTKVRISVFPVPRIGLVNPLTGEWHLDNGAGTVTTFYYGNPGDYPFMGDWDCDGVDTPGLYRQSDGYVYLRNSNTQGEADITFFFGNPGDVPVAGTFDSCGCDTVSIYRPSEARFYVITELGEDGGGLGAADYSFLFGDAGDKP
ncbi:MAG: Ig-like domain-containing protein, partial [Actinomycetota bacterium]|nr:Ig-like domain-containing protein [Actinomycetota bacterium]